MDFIFESSGTTGAQKKVVVPEAAFLALAEVDRTDLEIDPYSCLLMDRFGTGGYIQFYRARVSGARLSIYPGRERVSMRDWIVKAGVTHLSLIATTFRWLCQGIYIFPLVKIVEVGGEMVDWGDVELCRERFPNAIFFNRYAASEARIIARKRVDRDQPLGTGRMPVGRPLKGVSVDIIKGEIVVRSPFLSTGYYQDQVLTNAKFRPEGYYTGDLGEWISGGELMVHGRMVLNEWTSDIVSEFRRKMRVHECNMLSATHGGEVK